MSLGRFLVKGISKVSTARFVLGVGAHPSLKLVDKLQFSLFAGETTRRVQQQCTVQSFGMSLKNICACYKHTQTNGDKDLTSFLQEEISYEQESVMEIPTFKDFKLEMHGTLVHLTRNINGEHIAVSFDVNHNVNVDEDINDEDHDDVDTPDITSYPAFSVKITKPSGKTLEFNCSCNTGLNEEDLEGETPEDEQFDLFRFDDVKISNENSNDSSYEAQTDTMDGELYSMLMTTLLERGITGVLINDLIHLSTAVEHRHYLTFLKSLQEFASDK